MCKTVIAILNEACGGLFAILKDMHMKPPELLLKWLQKTSPNIPPITWDMMYCE